MPSLKPSRRQAVATTPMVKPGFLVPLQTAIHGPTNPRRPIALQHPIQQLGDHLLHLRHGQRGRLFFFPAWFPASGTRSPTTPAFDDGANLPRCAPDSPLSPLLLWRAEDIPQCNVRL